MKVAGWIQSAATFAPMIAAGLGSPLAGMAVKWIFNALGKKAPADPDQALKLAKTLIETISPEDQAKIRATDADFKAMADAETEVDLMKYKVELEDIYARDRDSARNLGIKAGLKPQIILSFAVLLIFSVVIYIAFTTPLDESNQILLIMGGGVLSAFTQVLNYWFGSSKGSADKTEALTKK